MTSVAVNLTAILVTQTQDNSIYQSFRQPIRPPSLPLGYLLGLGLVTLAMVILPFVYLALVGAISYGVYWHAVHNLAWIAAVPGYRLRLIVMAVYAGILFVGVVIVFFLLKPFLARSVPHSQPLALNPAAEPRLYAFVESICHALRAPSPRRIDLSGELNASASFRRGLLSFVGDDLVLTLGLPLVANLTLSELAGVIAHEFGHFNQGLAMRLYHVISVVNGWFARVVYQRDAWDQWLKELSEDSESVWGAITVFTAQAGVGLSRLFLGLLMRVGIALSAYLSRQMEYHADSCACAVVGSATAERLTQKLETLSVAMGQSFQMIRQGWNSTRRLPDNLPEVLRRVHEALPEEAKEKIHDRLGLKTSAWHDTHPAPADRIRWARRSQCEGIFHDNRPATSLFSRFDVPARQVTELFYADELGIPAASELLVPVGGETSTDVSGNSATSYRELQAGPIETTLLLGARELLLPLPLKFGGLGTEEFLSSEELKQELADLVARLGMVRPQMESLAQRARECSRRENPSEANLEREELGRLRRSAQEVIEETAHRLQLGLHLEWAELDPDELTEIRPKLDWLEEAGKEFESWRALQQAALSLCIRMKTISSKTTDFSGELEELRARRKEMKTTPASNPGEGVERSRRLRVGAFAEQGRELDAWIAEATQWLATYDFYLASAWSVAGRAEARWEIGPSEPA